MEESQSRVEDPPSLAILISQSYVEEPPSLATSMNVSLSDSRGGLVTQEFGHINNNNNNGDGSLMSPNRRNRRTTRRARMENRISNSINHVGSSSVTDVSNNTISSISPPPFGRLHSNPAFRVSDNEHPGTYSNFPSGHPSAQQQRPLQRQLLMGEHDEQEEAWKQHQQHHHHHHHHHHHGKLQLPYQQDQQEDEMTLLTEAMTTTTVGDNTFADNHEVNHVEFNHDYDIRNIIPEHLLQVHAATLAQQEAEYEHYHQKRSDAAAAAVAAAAGAASQRETRNQQQNQRPYHFSEETLAFGQFAADAIQSELEVQYVLLDASTIPSADLVYSLMQFSHDPMSHNEPLCYQVKLVRITVTKYELRQLTELSRNSSTMEGIPYLCATTTWDNEWEFVCEELDHGAMVEVALPNQLLDFLDVPLIRTIVKRLRHEGTFPRHDDWVPGVLLVVRHLCRIHDLPLYD